MSEMSKSLDKLSENMDVTSSQDSVSGSQEVVQSSAKLSHSCDRKNKKHRRGKKRKKTNYHDNNNSDNNSLKTLNPNYVKRRRRSLILIRPENVPKAPQNSTQFIIDDHEDCKMYLSFDYLRSQANNSNNCSSTGIRTGFSPKANENYEIYDSEETSQFYLNDFEMAFNKARFDELMKKDRNELVDMCQRLENTVTALQRRLLFINPNEVLDELQDELINLQEENKTLRQKNRKLKKSVNEKTFSNSYTNSSDEDENDSGNVMHCEDHYRDVDYDDHRSYGCSSCDSDSDSSSSSSSTTATTHSSNEDKLMSDPIEDICVDSDNRQLMIV